MYRKKILFIKPYSGRKNSVAAPPMGLLYLSSAVKKRFPGKYNIKLVDMRLDRLTLSDVKQYIKKYSPDYVGLSVCSEEHEKMEDIAKISKEICPSVSVIAGGPHATMAGEKLLEKKNIDVSVIGEGERTICALLECLENDGDLGTVLGIIYRKNGKTVRTPQRDYIKNLNLLPYPDWDLLKIEKYSDPGRQNMNAILKGRKYMGLVTSRGCPYRCIYCHNIFGSQFRKRSAEDIFNEIHILVKKHKIDEFHIYDDIFNLDPVRLHKLCDMIINSGMKINIAFPNGLRGDILSKKAIYKLKKAGAYMLTFALESASERLQELIRKKINKPRLLENIKTADRLGLLTKCYFMLGFPTESREEIGKTIDFALDSPLCFASFFVVTPQHGTDLMSMVKKNWPDYGFNHKTSYYYSQNINYEKLTGMPLKEIQCAAYRRFYLAPRRILKILVRIPRRIFLIRNFFRFSSFFYK